MRRSAREGATVPIEDFAPILPVSSNTMPSLELRDLEVALGKLPHEQRQVILLAGLEGMSYDKVASIIQVPIGTVRSRLSRRRDQLHRLMGVESEPATREHPRAA